MVVAVCTGDIRRVDVSSSRKDLPGAHLSATPHHRSFTVDVAEPGRGWSGPRLDRLEPGVSYVVLATGGGDLIGGAAAMSTRDIDFTAAELSALDPTRVQTVEYGGPYYDQRTTTVQTRPHFLQHACRRG